MAKTGTDKTVSRDKEHTHSYDTTYDSVASPDPETAFLKNRVDFGTDNAETVTHNTSDKTTFNSNDSLSFTNREDKTTYSSDIKNEYNSGESSGRNENRKDLELQIRQGNIGVTKSTELIDSQRATVMFDFFKLVVKDCVNQCTYAVE